MEPPLHLNILGGSIYPEQAPLLAGRVEGLPFDFAQGKCALTVKVHLWAHLERVVGRSDRAGRTGTRPLKRAFFSGVVANSGGDVERLNQIGVYGAVVVALCVSAGAFAAQNQPASQAEAAPKEVPMVLAVQDNMDVGMEYTLTAEGAVVDSTAGKSPFHYVQGRRQIIPGLERQLTGLHVGDSKEITVSPDEGYGPVDQSAFLEVPKAQLPKDVTPTIGMVLRGIDANGKTFRATVSEVKNDAAILNLNHPLAGKTLVFKVKITDLSPAKVQ